MGKQIVKIEIESNKELYLSEFEQTMKRILTKVGQQAAKAAAYLAQVDTGLLKNSITFALAGEKANISQYKADMGDGKGSYEGNSPGDKKYEHSVHIGSNVSYAMVQETGTFKTHGESHAYLRPGINQNIDYFREIAQGELEKATVND